MEGIFHSLVHFRPDFVSWMFIKTFFKVKIGLIHVGRSGSEWRHSKAMVSCQIFLVVSMIWFSYTDKLYIKIHEKLIEIFTTSIFI